MGGVASNLVLQPGQYMLSSDNDVMLIYNSDGTLKIHQVELLGTTYDAYIESEKHANSQNIMVLYVNDSFKVFLIKNIWSSIPSPNGIGGKCVYEPDGYIKLYDSNKKLYWKSPNWKVTNETKPYQLRMQKDGNLVVYDKNNKAVYATGTNIRKNDDKKRDAGDRDYYKGKCTIQSC